MGNEVGDPISITYNQARGIDPIDDGEKIGMKVGKALGMRNIRKTESKKVTESFFRDSFEDWYDFLDEEEKAEVDQYMEDEGMPDMVTDLSRTDMENILGHFDSDRLEDLYDQEDEGRRIVGGWQFDEGPDDEDLEEECKKTEGTTESQFAREPYFFGFYGDDCGKYDSLDALISTLKKAGIKVFGVTGDEDYGWEFYVDGIAKDVFKLIDGKVPGYDCDDVMDFIQQYSVDPEEVSGYDDDLYSDERLSKDIPDEEFESVEPLKESFRDDFYDWYDFLDDATREEVDAYMEEEGYPDMVTDLSDSDMEMIMDHFNPDYFDSEPEELDEDTVKKSNGKWTNKGKDGEHGEFKTKKAADAQRKAMFANGYKGEAWGDSLRDAPNPYDDEDEEYSDFSDGSVRRGDKFIEDGIEYEWVDEVSDTYYLDFDAWQVWKAERTEDLEEAYFVVDKDTGFIDWGPCDTEMEAVEFLHSKVDDYNNDDLSDGLLESVSGDASSRIMFLLRKHGFTLGRNAEVNSSAGDIIAVNFYGEHGDIEKLKADISELDNVENVRYSKWNDRMTIYLN